MTAINTTPSSIDELGMLLAQIADLTKRAEAIKDAFKDAASKGGATSIEGALFKATYTEADRTIFDKKAFVKAFSEDEYNRYTKTTAVFSVKVTSR
jgi:citrate lyase beta subunit